MKSLTAILALTLAASACSTTQQPITWTPHAINIEVVRCAYGPDKEEARDFAQQVALREFGNYSSAKPRICYHQNPDGAQCARISLQKQVCEK